MKPWYIFDFKPYKGVTPDFLDLHKYSWYTNLEKNKYLIREELKPLLDEKEKFIPYFNHLLDDKSSGWKTISFKTWGINVPNNLKKYPQLHRFLQDNPDILSMAVSKLEANTKINPHRGDTDAIIRCHMGIKVPEKLPECGFRVNNTEKSWEESKTFGFIDANEHEAWNNTSSERIILLFDVIRPEFRSKKLQISIRVRAFLLTQVLLFKIPFLLKVPKKSLLPLYYCIWMLLWCLYPLQKKYGVFRKHD